MTLAVFHVGNFGIQRNNTNDAGSVRIGTSGGLGGDTVGYRHSHLEVHRGRGLPATMRARNAAIGAVKLKLEWLASRITCSIDVASVLIGL